MSPPATEASLPITLRRATPADAAALARQMVDDAVFANLMQLPWPTEALWRQRLETMAAAGETADLLLLAERGGSLLGSVGLHPVERVRRRHAAMLGISVGAAHQGGGVGTALYRRFGFQEEGRHRAYALRDGHYVDVLSMVRLHPNPPAAAWPAPGAPA